METQANIPSARPHPLLLAAAASVTALSLAGVGVLAGWLPPPTAHRADAAPAATVATPVVTPAAAPISIQQNVAVPQEKPRQASASGERGATYRALRTAANGSGISVEPGAPAAAPVASVQRTSAAEPTYVQAATVACPDCGYVESVREVAVEPKGSGTGAVAGGIVGGILGNQVGKGATRDIATVLGAVGGAFAGNHIEKSVKDAKRYDVMVRFDDGSTRTFSSDTAPAWHSGDRVRLQNGALAPAGRAGSSSGVI